MNGILNAYKPKGPTSHDVVDELRKKLKVKKIGHAGTLDPFAKGVLVVGVGRKATRILELLKDDKKVYWVKMILGVITETYDITGEVVEEREVNVSEEDIINVVNGFVGEYLQVPPAYSAKKYKGKKLYELAREGKIIRLPPKKVTIYRIWDLEVDIPYVSFRAEVSPGTYLRSLCMDIGHTLGCGATAVELVREASGSFRIEYSINPFSEPKEKIIENLIPVEKVLENLPGIVLNKSGVTKVLNGGSPFLEDVAYVVGEFKKGDVIKLLKGDTIIALGIAERASKFIETLERHGRNEKIAKLHKVLGV